MTSQEENSFSPGINVETDRLIAPIKRRWWLILLMTIVTAVASYFVISQQPPYYRTGAVMMIGNIMADPNPSSGEINLTAQLAQTYADIANLQQVRQSIRQQLGLTTLPEYSVTASPNSQLIQIGVTDTSPERAVAVANELASQIELRSPTSTDPESTERQDFVNAELDELELNLETTKAEITAKQQELAEAFSASDIDRLNAEISALEGKGQALQTNYASLLSSTSQGATNTISVIQAATVPREPAGPNVLLNVMTTTAIGFLLIMGAVYILEFMDDTIRTTKDISQASNLPRLTVIPKLKISKNEYELITLEEPNSFNAEVFRKLRMRIVSANPEGETQKLLFSSAGPGEGKSLISANLAVVLAQADRRVLMVDADLRKPSQNDVFGIANSKGLATLLASPELDPTNPNQAMTLPEENYIQRTKIDNLDILLSGRPPSNPTELLGSERMTTLMALLSEKYDYIILDGPPAMAVTDALVISHNADGVMIVVRAKVTRRRDLEESIKQFRDVNANLMGVIANSLDHEVNARYYYNRYYHPDDEDFEDEQPVSTAQTASEQRAVIKTDKPSQAYES